MLKILVPLDGSANAVRVTEYLIGLAARTKDTELHLINVRDPMDSLGVNRFWSDDEVRAFHQGAGELALHAARQVLAQAGITYTANIVVGEVAQTIADYATDQRCDAIVMGTRGMGTLGGDLMGSVAATVVHLAPVPVTLVK